MHKYFKFGSNCLIYLLIRLNAHIHHLFATSFIKCVVFILFYFIYALFSYLKCNCFLLATHHCYETFYGIPNLNLTNFKFQSQLLDTNIGNAVARCAHSGRNICITEPAKGYTSRQLGVYPFKDLPCP